MRLGFAVLTALTVAATPALAQPRALTIDDLYDPQKRIDVSGGAPSGLTWVSDTHYVWPRPEAGGVAWTSVEAATGASTPLFEAKAVSDRAAEAVGLDSAVIGQALASRGLEMNPTRTAAVVAIDHDLYYVPFGANDRVQRLTSTAEPEEEFTFSPNGEFVSFLRGNDLYVVDVDHRRERRLTTDGGPQLLNGKLDWVYQEEIYGRGNYRAYWWSPTSRHLAFLQLDEQPVPEFTVVDHIPRRLAVETWDYPKPGDPNPGVKLGVVSVSGSAPA
jgi:dipeptidyl-peptidase-4